MIVQDMKRELHHYGPERPIDETRWTVTAVNEMLRLLPADGPRAEFADKMMLFGQFVGSWDLDVFGYRRDGTRLHYAGEWHFGWVLDGHGIQDVLIVSRGSTDEQDVPQGGKGSTLRVYDPQLDAWWISWMGPLDREFSTLLAREEHDRILLEGQWALGHPDKRWQWVFSDINPRSFRWECLFLDQTNDRARVTEEIHARRRD
jgi:hypothetical protein